jgi:hypothetical protein
MQNSISQPKAVLKPGTVYLADNGMAICLCCAGRSARLTGRDISGQPVSKVTADDLIEFGAESMSCECGRTTVVAA